MCSIMELVLLGGSYYNQCVIQSNCNFVCILDLSFIVDGDHLSSKRN